MGVCGPKMATLFFAVAANGMENAGVQNCNSEKKIKIKIKKKWKNSVAIIFHQ